MNTVSATSSNPRPIGEHPGEPAPESPVGGLGCRDARPLSFASRYTGWLMRVYRRLWLGRIDSATPAIAPGAVIFAAHYNGAVDGFTYGSQLPGCVGVVSVQWHRRAIGRWLFPGIAVERAKDGVTGAANLTAFRRMVKAVADGERLLFFPEGTSRLGPARLPIARGSLLLLRALRGSGKNPQVYFTAAHYHTPTRWRSNVAVGWIGPVAMPTNAADDEAWLQRQLLAAQSAAYDRPVPPAYRLTWLAALIALPFLPVWYVTSTLARRTADEENVVSLWKFLFGVPVTFFVAAVYALVMSRCGIPAWLPLASLAGGWLLWNR